MCANDSRAGSTVLERITPRNNKARSVAGLMSAQGRRESRWSDSYELPKNQSVRQAGKTFSANAWFCAAFQPLRAGCCNNPKGETMSELPHSEAPCPAPIRAHGARRINLDMRARLDQADQFTGLPSGTAKPFRLLAAFEQAEPYLGLPPHSYKLIGWLVRQTKPHDWEEGSRPIAWPSAQRQAEFLGLSVPRHLVAWISRVDAVIAGPLGLMRCGRSWGVPAPACGSGCRQQLPPRLLDACRFASAARDRFVSSGRYRLPPRHASCTPTLSANPCGHVRQSRADAGHAVWAPSRPSGSAPHSTAVAR